MKNIILDFDGVLGDTWTVNVQNQIKMGSYKNLVEAEIGIRSYFDNPHNHGKKDKPSPEKLAELQKWVSGFGELMLQSKFDLFDGFVEELKKLQDVRFAVVSTGSSKYVVPACGKSGLNFTHILSFEDHHSKEEKIEVICRDWGVNVSDVYYFTDSKADVYELENFLDKSKIIGCSWGYCGFEKLLDVLPENQILKEFSDINKVID